MLNLANQSISKLINKVNIVKKIKNQFVPIAKAQEELNQRLRDLELKQNDLKFEQIKFQLSNRAATLKMAKPMTERMIPVPPLLRNYETYDMVLNRFEKKYAVAFPFWKQLTEFAIDSYLSDPLHSLSVEGHPIASCFGDFVSSYLQGSVLDVGCGVAEIPLYLRHYPLAAIAGLDPEKSPEKHPFTFVQGIAEYIPWPDNSFDTIIIATSLDHVLSLEDTLAEVRRVLKPNGSFLVWVCFIAGSEPYSPLDDNIQPLDAYHMFHFDEPWFEDLMKKYFIRVEKVNIDGQSHFYCFTPR